MGRGSGRAVSANGLASIAEMHLACPCQCGCNAAERGVEDKVKEADAVVTALRVHRDGFNLYEVHWENILHLI